MGVSCAVRFEDVKGISDGGKGKGGQQTISGELRRHNDEPAAAFLSFL